MVSLAPQRRARLTALSSSGWTAAVASTSTRMLSNRSIRWPLDNSSRALERSLSICSGGGAKVVQDVFDECQGHLAFTGVDQVRSGIPQ